MVKSAETGDWTEAEFPSKFPNGIKSVFLNHEAEIRLQNEFGDIEHNVTLPDGTPITCLNLDSFIDGADLQELTQYGIKRRGV